MKINLGHSCFAEADQPMVLTRDKIIHLYQQQPDPPEAKDTKELEENR